MDEEFFQAKNLWVSVLSKTIQRALLDMNIWLAANKPFVNRETSKVKLVWNSEAWCYLIKWKGESYWSEKEKVIEGESLFNDWLLQWGFPDDGRLVPRIIFYHSMKIT